MDILNCRVTKSDTQITKFFGKQVDGTWHTGCDITAHNVYSICDGVVINIAKEQAGTFVVTVQYDNNRCVRYGNLSDVEVSLGKPIVDGQMVGRAAKSVHFEYCLKNQTSRFPFRVGSATYYKTDPIQIIRDEIAFMSYGKNMGMQNP